MSAISFIQQEIIRSKINFFYFEENYDEKHLYHFCLQGFHKDFKDSGLDWNGYQQIYLENFVGYLNDKKTFENYFHHHSNLLNGLYMLKYLLLCDDGYYPNKNICFFIFDQDNITCVTRSSFLEDYKEKRHQWIILRYNYDHKKDLVYYTRLWFHHNTSYYYNTWDLKDMIHEIPKSIECSFIKNVKLPQHNYISTHNQFSARQDKKHDPYGSCTAGAFFMSVMISELENLDLSTWDKKMDEKITNYLQMATSLTKNDSGQDMLDIYNQNPNLFHQLIPFPPSKQLLQKLKSEKLIQYTINISENILDIQIKLNKLDDLLYILKDYNCSAVITIGGYTTGITFFSSGQLIYYDTHAFSTEQQISEIMQTSKRNGVAFCCIDSEFFSSTYIEGLKEKDDQIIQVTLYSLF